MLKFEMDFSEIEEFAERLGNYDEFETMLEDVVEQIAKELHEILVSNTPVKEGALQAGWGSASELRYKIEKVSGGYSVDISNKVPYAYAVNYGHMVYNQAGGPWQVRKRIKVPDRSIHDTTNIDEDYYVFGHFFLEESIYEFTDGTDSIRLTIKEKLREWWEWCFSG